VDLNDFMPVDNLQPSVRDRVLREFADLFDRTPEQVYMVLTQHSLRFDKRGSRVNVNQFKTVDQLGRTILGRHHQHPRVEPGHLPGPQSGLASLKTHGLGG
jgi:hypothetical protein